jgi:hypothetical protein
MQLCLCWLCPQFHIYVYICIYAYVCVCVCVCVCACEQMTTNYVAVQLSLCWLCPQSKRSLFTVFTARILQSLYYTHSQLVALDASLLHAFFSLFPIRIL